MSKISNTELINETKINSMSKISNTELINETKINSMSKITNTELINETKINSDAGRRLWKPSRLINESEDD